MLFPRRRQPAEAPGRFAWVTVMQFAEGLSERQAAEAVHSRIDWKYALALEVTDSGFDASVLSEFRGRLIAGNTEQVLFETLLTRFREAGLLKPRGRQRTDSTQVLAAIHTFRCASALHSVLWRWRAHDPRATQRIRQQYLIKTPSIKCQPSS